MGLILTNIRIKNFRSLETVDLTLGITNILIGQNNTGKSNFLKAISIALGNYREISENDIFISEGQRLDSNKSAIIDIILRPLDEDGKIKRNFSDYWAPIFTDTWITTDETNGDFVGIRTKIQYDVLKDDYSINRYSIAEWNTSIEDTKIRKPNSFNRDMSNSLTSFYMDAQRDIVEDLKNRKSYFSKTVTSSDLTEEKTLELEERLNSINKEIIDSIPSLNQTSKKIRTVGNTIGAVESIVEIEPLSRKISDLHRGLDIVFQDTNAAKFSISQHGMGTRSWISFLTLSAYVEWHDENIKKEDEDAEIFVILTMEEPEAHLHPQAQRHLYDQIRQFKGQKIISTHSQNVLAQANLSDIIHFFKEDGRTITNRFNSKLYNDEEMNRINREVINTRGELLFSHAIVLCEGITEEQALPIFFEEYFGMNPIFCGINIIGIGGQNYKTFLNLIRDFRIKWYIFSDGEKKAIKSIQEAITVITSDSLKNMKNIFIIDNNESYEKYLITSGYTALMIEAINEYENDTEYFNKFLLSHNNTSAGRKKTDKPKCKTCGQDIYEDIIREYSGDDGKSKALLDCCINSGSKTKYASVIAQKIIKHADVSRRIPPKIKTLFSVMSSDLHIDPKEEYRYG